MKILNGIIGKDCNFRFLFIFLSYPSRLPTLFLSECCLMYLKSEIGDEIVNFISTLKDCWFCLFDPILLDDKFGQIMFENFISRNFNVNSLLNYSSIHSIKKRFEKFKDIQFWKMIDLEDSSLLSDEDKKILKFKLFLDEYEEWNLLASHYLLILARQS
jgi:[phosphatase 2A protein]-leucine-carboxy methyltransferase